MRRVRQNVVSVSLFPFLAVLICTLGVLIVMLVLAVQSAKMAQEEQQDTRDREDADIEQKIKALESEIDFRNSMAETLTEVRPEVSGRLSQAREHRSHLENEIRKLNAAAEKLVAEIKAFEESENEAAAEPDGEKLLELEQQLADAKEALAEKRATPQVETKKKFAIVPYHGTGTTQRVPIYVECFDDKLVLQPWNITLEKTDFAYPIQPGNPLDAALLAVRNYFVDYKLTENGQRPYPLLIVRPSGSQSYALARRSMSSWDDEFGYELIGAEKDLDFGPVDDQLRERIQEAVDLAIRNQRVRAARQQAALQARRGTGGTSEENFRGGYRASRNGGFEREFEPAGFEETNSNPVDQAQQIPNFERGVRVDEVRATDKELEKQHNPNGQSATQAIADQRGSNWALPTRTSDATGFVRLVSVFCDANSIRLKNANGQTEHVSLGEAAGIETAAVDRMVNIVWERIESWGIAGANAYWKPTLSFKVRPGGEQRFEQLQILLNRSGLGIEREAR